MSTLLKKHLSTIVIVLIFIGGLLVFSYPTISNLYNEKVGSYVVAGYKQEVEVSNEDNLGESIKRAEEYNSDILRKGRSFLNGEPSSEDYNSQLRVGNNDTMGYVEIEKINVSLPIYHGTGEGVLQSGIGHLEGSALPVGGVNNHSVLSGHTGLPSAKLLTNLDKLQIGDKIVIKVLKDTLTYSVVQINTVLPEEIELLKPQEGKDLLTLFTCTPYGINSHRLLVMAERVDNDEEEEKTIIASGKDINTLSIAAFSLSIVAVVILIIFIGKKRRSRKER
ncbi:MAG: class C sortase [Clostridium sp.]